MRAEKEKKHLREKKGGFIFIPRAVWCLLFSSGAAGPGWRLYVSRISCLISVVAEDVDAVGAVFVT